jgi:hypothetical protein
MMAVYHLGAGSDIMTAEGLRLFPSFPSYTFFALSGMFFSVSGKCHFLLSNSSPGLRG